MRLYFLSMGLVIIILVSCKKNDFNSNKQSIIAADITISSDSVKLNPTGYAPLCAVVNFSSPVAGRTVIIVKGKNGVGSDIENVFNDPGLSHSIPVVGLYANFSNTVLVRSINNNGDTVAKSSINIQTGTLPAELYSSIVPDVQPTTQVEKGIDLVSNFSRYGFVQPSNPLVPLMVDNYGDIRWLLDYTTHPLLNQLTYDCGIKRLRNGNFYFGDVVTDKIYEVDILGKVINIWDLSTTGYSFHHDINEKPDGNFIISVSKAGSTHTDGSATIEDYIVELDRQAGSIKNVWDLKESLDEYRNALYSNTPDWIHVNSVLYDSTDNTIIISGRHQGVVKLTFDNKVKWILSPHRGWGTNRRGEDLNQFLLTPLDANGNAITDTSIVNGSANHPDFEWNWYQHSPIHIPNGDIMLFDNGDIRNFNASGAQYSRAVEYKIDVAHMTVQQKWQYGKERGLETFSRIVSSVQYLPETNHVLFCPGYQVINIKGQGGKVVEVDYATRQVVSQLSFSGDTKWGFHRTQRISVYPN